MPFALTYIIHVQCIGSEHGALRKIRCEVKGWCVKMERIVQLLIHEFYFAVITCLERLCEHAFRLLGRRFVVTLRLKHHLQHNWQVHLIWMTDANTEAHLRHISALSVK